MQSAQPGFPSASTTLFAERRAMASRMKRLSQGCGGIRRKRATIADSECWMRRALAGRGGEGGRMFCGAKKGGSTITAPANSSPKSRARPIATRPPNEWPTTIGGPASNAPPMRPASRASRTNCSNLYASRQSERPMPVKVGATTRRSRAKNGAMNDHQSACAAPPCRNIRPGLPRSPQARTSTLAPSTSTKVRSGSCAVAFSNHAGAGGLSRDRRQAAP